MLSQAKRKIPLLLPGFESIEVAEEYSGPFSDVVSVDVVHPTRCFTVWNFMGGVRQGVARSVLMFAVIGLCLLRLGNDELCWVSTVKRLGWFLTVNAF